MDIQGDKGQAQSELESDPNAFQRIGTELKSTTFAMVSLLVKDQEVSLYIAAFIPIMEFLQVMGFAFHDRVLSSLFPFLTSLGYQSLGFSGTARQHLRVLPFFEETNWTVYSAIYYLLLGIILFLVLGLAYIYYMSSRRRPAFAWPVQAIGVILAFASSTLFLPAFEYITSIFACAKNQNDVLLHRLFPDVKCWQTFHMAEGIMAIFGSIIFVIIATLTTLMYFEARPVSNNLNARINSRALLIFNIYKFFLVLIFNFLPDKDYQIAQIAYLLIGSTIVFAKFQYENPFYNEIIKKVWSTMAALNLWTVIMLVFAKIMEDNEFKETIFVWLIMAPLVIFVNLNNADKRLSYFLINTNKFQSGDEVMNHISYLRKLINIQNSSKTAATMLDGYLEIHKQDCFNEQCPCRNKSKVINNNRITRNLLISDDNMSEKDAIMIYLIYQLYVKGTKAFPNSTSLWISYSFFLLDKMGSKQQALQVLSDAEQRSPAIDYEFILFRYKKIIEDEIAESQNENQADNGLDIGSETSFQNHLRLCQANIEKSALLHMEFWSQLSEDQPDLAKVGEIGAKISASIKAVEDQWSKLVKINPNNVKSMRLFGKFLIEVLHNRERGEELLERASNFANINFNKKNINIYANKDFSDEATPAIVISGEQETFGAITNVNLAAASLFGFNKNELLNKKLNTLMPPLYAKYHDSFLERYLQTNDSMIIGKNKERLAFGKTKSNYTFPFFYNVKAIPSMMQGVQFVATFRVEKKLRNTAYMIAYPDGTIDAISSSCISLLKIDKATLQKKPKIQDFIPNILSDRHLLFASTSGGSKASTVINFTYPEDSEYLIDSDPPIVQLVCYLYDLVFLSGRENAGFQLRFEKPAEKSGSQTHMEARISNFQFSFNRNKPLIYGEYVSSSNAMTQDTQDYHEVLRAMNSSGIEGEANLLNSASGLKLNASSPKKSPDDNGLDIVKRTEYGVGIKTYRLIRGEVTDIEDDKSGGSDEESDNEKEMFNSQKKGQPPSDNINTNNNNNNVDDNLDEEGSLADFGNAMKSRKVLNSVINDRTPPPNLKRLNFAIHLLGFIMIGLSTWDYVNLLSRIKDIDQNLSSIGRSRTLVADMMIALSNIRDLYLINLGLLDDLDQQTLRTKIQVALDAAKSTKEILEKDKSNISDEHLNLYNSPIVSLRNYQASPTMRGLIQATEDIITKGLNLAGADLSQITSTNPDYYFFTYNLLNEYYQSLLRSAELYVSELFTRKDDTISSFTMILILTIIVLVVSIFILLPILLSVSRTEDQVLRLFLDIPDKIVKSLYSKCENFVSNLQVGEEEEMSELDDDEMDRENDQEAMGWQTRKKRKKFKNTRKSHRSFILGYLVISIIIESPSLYNFFASNEMLNNVADVAVEFNSTTFAELFFSFSNNVQRQLFIDPNVSVLNEASLTVATRDIELMRILNSDILSNNSVNIESHTTEYNDLFYQIFYGNPCPLLTGSISLTTCSSFANQTVPKGMSLLLVRHFENMNLLLDTYSDLKKGIAWPFSSTYIKLNVVPDTLKNQILSLMRLPRAKEIATAQDIYIKNTFRMLISNFIDNLSDDFESFKTVRLLVFTLFLVLVLVIYIFIWVPLMSRFSNKIWKTKAMLNMIPIGVIVKIKSIRTYLRNVLNENRLHQY